MKCVGNSRILSNTTWSIILESILSILILNLNHLLRQIIAISLLHLIALVLFAIHLWPSTVPVQHLYICIFYLLWTKWRLTFHLRCRVTEHIRGILIRSCVVLPSKNQTRFLICDCLWVGAHSSNLRLWIISLHHTGGWRNRSVSDCGRGSVSSNRMISPFTLTHICILRTICSSSILNIDISRSLNNILVMQIIINDLRASFIINTFIILTSSNSSSIRIARC